MFLVPKEYFTDPLTQGVAKGSLNFIMRNRFTLLKLPVGYGKTVISMQVARQLAELNNGKLQLMVIAPKAKRLDKSFQDAINSTNAYYNVKLTVLPINGQETGTFAGLNQMSKKPTMFKDFLTALCEENTLLILDETHMQLRNPTGIASKLFKKIFKLVEKNHRTLRILGLTATPFDRSIIDAVGYLVLNGNYRSRTGFYRKEVVGYETAHTRGLTQQDVENSIVDQTYAIHKEMFHDIINVTRQINNIVYAPDAPVTFHIPQNRFRQVPVELSPAGADELRHVQRLERERAYADNGTKVTDYTTAITTDQQVLDKVVELAKDPNNHQPLIFYQLNVTLDALKKRFEAEGLSYLEVNGHSQSYFELNDGESAVFVQYLSGAAAFESKTSNSSIYLDLPSSSINFQQSLGRNARRGQDVDVVMNYIIVPQLESGPIAYFEKNYNRVVNKAHWNARFEKTFVTPWGRWGETQIKTKNM